jgi:N-acyl-D-aspartate/D-glutamate deacylase
VAEAVRQLTSVPAKVAGLADRGRIAVGYKADLNVIDHARLTLHKPVITRDLPAGGRRLDQTADGYVATIVSGEVIAENGLPTSARPGRLIRGRRPAPAVEGGPLDIFRPDSVHSAHSRRLNRAAGGSELVAHPCHNDVGPR